MSLAVKICARCDKEYLPASPNQYYCAECRPEVKRAAALASVHKWRENHPGWARTSEARAQGRKKQLMRKYGLTVEEYEALLQKQGGVCAICGKPNANGFFLSVDHDHRTGKVRALLCCQCNAAIGQLCEDIELMKKVIAYIKATP